MRNRKRFNHVRAGRRWRKTTGIMSILVEAMVKQPGPYIWGAPTFDQCRTCMDETRKALSGVAAFNEARMTATMPNGALILYRSLDNPQSLRSKTAFGAVIDEASMCDPRSWHEVMRPMLIDTGGWAFLMYTPFGRNWVYQDWQNSLDREDTALFHAPTLGVEITSEGLKRKPHPLENPFIPFDEMVNVFRSTPIRSFQQEYLAEFVEDGGGVFRGVRRAVRPSGQTRPDPQHTYVAGLDWALTTDYTVLTVLDVTAKEVVFIARFNGVEYALQRQRIAADCARWNVSALVAEANAMGKPNNDELRRAGVRGVRDFTTTHTTKAAIMEKLAAAFDHDQIALPNDPVLIGELEAYEQERRESGTMKYGAPPGMHDDTVMSLALAWSAANASKGIYI